MELWEQLLAAALVSVCCMADPLPRIILFANDLPIDAETAHTDEARSRGLTHRKGLSEGSGMLFVFRESAMHAMWMRNTGIPLSVAFMDEHGRILNIEEMMPNTRNHHSAARPAKYALEVNRGWFEAHGVMPGMYIQGLDSAPAAR